MKVGRKTKPMYDILNWNTLESIFNEIESFGVFFIIEISLEIEQSLRFLLENNGLHPCLATGKRERERERERERGQCYKFFLKGI